MGQFGALLQILHRMGEEQQLVPLIADTLPHHCVYTLRLVGQTRLGDENLVSLWLSVLLLGRCDVQKNI